MPVKTVTLFRLGEEKLNNQGCLMKIVEYNKCDDIVVEFQDKYKCRIRTRYSHFSDGGVINPYRPNVLGVGIVGNKYPAKINGEHTKEYKTWRGVISRSYGQVEKRKRPKYKDVICCDEWLLYENFYEWLHSQENFNKWINSDKLWAIDKDILIKGNKVYSPETCCLVPLEVNALFLKSDALRGKYPIGVHFNKRRRKFCAQVNIKRGHQKFIGAYNTIEEAFYAYKKEKEALIKQVAQEEYDKGNITKACYDTMMNYEVEITD